MGTVTLGQDAWEAYRQPLEQRIFELEPEMPGSQAIADLKRELPVYKKAEGRFAYMFFILKKEGLGR